MAAGVIDFQLDRPQNNGELTYRPFGVVTVKIELSSETTDQPALRLRVKRKTADDLAQGTFRGFPDDSDALMISWGGGHEPGPCVKPKDFLKFKENPAPLPKGEKSYTYFNVTHIVVDDLPETATLTIEAYEPGDAHQDEVVTSTLTITLKKPDFVPDKIRLMEPVPGESDTYRIQDGKYLAAYDPRWWPEGVAYAAETGELPLIIRRVENRLELYWGGSAKPVAVLTDNTDPSILVPGDHQRSYQNTALFDLFNFDDHHIALRLWFYWLNKRIGGKQFVTRHEVPDAERFDIVIRKDNGAAVFVCTDLHWSEMWGEVPEPPLIISLGLSRERILKEVKEGAKKKADKILKGPAKWLGFSQEAEGASGGQVDEEEANEATEFHNPITFVRGRVKARYAKESVNKVREKGLEAHVPQMHGVIEYHRSRFDDRNQMVSNDVRLVFDL
ncbi:MAG: hypothetical protein WAM60_11405 [Candidatus Promineifilaceae bacterium]